MRGADDAMRRNTQSVGSTLDLARPADSCHSRV